LVNLSLNYLERNKYLGVQSKFRCSWRWRRKNFISIWIFLSLCEYFVLFKLAFFMHTLYLHSFKKILTTSKVKLETKLNYIVLNIKILTFIYCFLCLQEASSLEDIYIFKT
jgi:hypothetical protein